MARSALNEPAFATNFNSRPRPPSDLELSKFTLKGRHKKSSPTTPTVLYRA
jgi:hypothetical protein